MEQLVVQIGEEKVRVEEGLAEFLLKLEAAYSRYGGWQNVGMSGPAWSFHDFGKIPYDKRPLIDYVFVRNGLKVLRYGVLAETENNAFLSDHAPILVTVE